MSEQIDLGLNLLDHQLIDFEGRRCGKVDDLDLGSLREALPRSKRSCRVHPPGEIGADWAG